MKFKRRLRIERGNLDITPLVDVIFLLLIFFMLSSSFVFNPGIKVDLPETTSSENIQASDLVVTITGQNMIFFRDQNVPLTMEGLKERLKIAAGKNKSARMILKADANVPHGRVVKVMSLAWESGVRKMAIATRPKEK